jgi:hypothetical protein
VLGAPGNQSLGDECGQYEAFVEALPPIDVAPRAAFPSVEPPSRRTCSRSTKPGSTSSP